MSKPRCGFCRSKRVDVVGREMACLECGVKRDRKGVLKTIRRDPSFGVGWVAVPRDKLLVLERWSREEPWD